MAKKRTTTTTTTSNYPVVKATAFWGIIISGIAGLITLVIKILIAVKLISGAGSAVSSIINIMNLVANIALFISVFLAAYAYSRGKSKVWRVLFWVFAVLAFLSLLGFNLFAIFGI